MKTELSFRGVPVSPDFTELRQDARAWAESWCDLLDLPPHQRRPFVDEFVERRLLEVTDSLTELYGTRDGDLE